ncbi:MAG: thioredoxin [Anaerolineae bacterium]
MTGLLKGLFGKKDESSAEIESVATAGTEPAAELRVASNGAPVHVTDQTFEEVILNAEVPAMVDFWAPWCGPCRMVGPVVEELARKYDGRVVIAKLNTDENVEMASRLGIMGIPTLILFKDGKEVDRIVGFAPQQTLEGRLQAVLGAS